MILEQKPLVSVCITAYNHCRYIRQCIQSVLDQNGDFEVEILIGDDMSHDKTREVIRDMVAAHPHRITPHFHSNNLGASSNLSFLIARAKGRFIAHLDGDDYWLPEKLSRQLKLFGENPDCVAVYGNGLVVSDEGIPIGRFHAPVQMHRLDLKAVVEKGNFLFHSSLLYRSSVKDAVLSIPGDFIDFRIHVRLADRGCVLLINDPVAVYRHASSSSMIRHMPDKVFRHYWEALQEAARLGAMGAAHSAAALFWERMFISSLRNLQIGSIVKWWRLCGRGDSVRLGLVERIWLIFRSARLAFIVIKSRLQSPDARVLYRR